MTKVTEDADIEKFAVECQASDKPNELMYFVLGRPVNHETGHSFSGLVTGELVGLKSDGCVPLVVFPGQTGSAAVPGRSIVELRGSHVGLEVALMFDGGDPAKPIVIGVFHQRRNRPGEQGVAAVEIFADGKRMTIDAHDQLILRCGKASITLTRAGKVLIDGEYVSSRSSGVNRIKGGAVQIN